MSSSLAIKIKSVCVCVLKMLCILCCSFLLCLMINFYVPLLSISSLLFVEQTLVTLMPSYLWNRYKCWQVALLQIIIFTKGFERIIFYIPFCIFVCGHFWNFRNFSVAIKTKEKLFWKLSSIYFQHRKALKLSI